MVEGPGNGDTLPLAARQARTVLTQGRVHAIGEALQQLIELSTDQRPVHALPVDGGVRLAKSDVSRQRVIENENVLGDISETELPGTSAFPKISTVDGDMA